jgi:hypothetical protein
LQKFFSSILAKNKQAFHVCRLERKRKHLVCFESKTPTFAYCKTLELCAALSSKISSQLFPRSFCTPSSICSSAWKKVLSYLSSLPGKLNEAGHLLLLQTHKRATCASALAPRVPLLQPRKGGKKVEMKVS